MKTITLAPDFVTAARALAQANPAESVFLMAAIIGLFCYRFRHAI